MTQNKSEIIAAKNTQTNASESLIWKNETIPRSVQFNDTFNSKADGLLETQYVFIRHKMGGTITFNFSSNITLTFYIGAPQKRASLNSRIGAWYLDGYSPAINSDLWNETLMQQLMKNTAPNGTFATYSASSFILKNFTHAGFNVERIKGHAGKRHLSIGTLL